MDRLFRLGSLRKSVGRRRWPPIPSGMVQPPKIACHARKIPPFLYEPEKRSLIGLENCWVAANNKIHREMRLGTVKGPRASPQPWRKAWRSLRSIRGIIIVPALIVLNPEARKGPVVLANAGLDVLINEG